MAPRILAILGLVAWLAIVAPIPAIGADAPLPAYEAAVVGDDVYALSGPGINYYPTQLLTPGQKVTVIGEPMGEWLAIQPPRGSFSWVLAREVEERMDGAVIAVDEAKVRVGSALSDARHVFQVTLKKGDAVNILDKVISGGEGKAEVWYKILPPENEVRYVDASSVKAPQPTPNPDAKPAPSPAKPAGEHKVPAAETKLPAARPSDGRPTPMAATPTSAAGPPRAVSGRVIPLAVPIEIPTPKPPVLEPASAAEATDDSGPPLTVVDDPSLPISERLKALQSQIRLLRTRAPTTWDVASARKVVLDLQEAAATSDDREEVARTSQAVIQLADLQERYQRAARRRQLAIERDKELAVEQKQIERSLDRSTPAFTAEGMLRDAVIRVDGKTTYTLTDADGKATHYVIAPAGLNLEGYVGKRVGLMGDRSARPTIPVPVLTVEQLTPMDAVAGN